MKLTLACADIHSELHPPTVSERKVDTKLPIEPTGEVRAPLGNIAGDREPVGPTRIMTSDENTGIEGAFTKDGEGSAGLPFDANMTSSKKEGDIAVQEESSVIPMDMMSSTETIKNHKISSIATAIEQPEKPRLGTPDMVEDVKLPKETPLSQDGTAMEVGVGVKDERPDWLRAAEMMGKTPVLAAFNADFSSK